MDKMADVLGRAGAWCGQNKYLSAIKNAFQNFMPLTIAGAIGVLWCNVLVNESTGLGLFFKPIMALDFLNPAFQAVNFCTISCITVGITLGIAQEIGVWNMGAERAGYIPGLVGLAAWLSVTNTSHMVDGAKEAFTGVAGNELGATGLFTGMIIGVLSVELFCFFEKQDALKIKMPDGVPPMIANTFTALIPAILVGLIFIAVATIFSFTPYGSFTQLVYTVIVTPLNSLGGSVWSLVVLILVQMLLWFFGIHGSNVISGVITAVYLPMATANLEAYAAGKALPNILCNTFYDTFSGIGGAGGTLSLCIVILLFAKSKQNKTMGKLGIIPGLFTINEPVVFGYPLIMNPLMAIPFILTPIVQTLVAYFSMYIGLVPRFTGVQVPWCMPIILKPLLAGGWQAAILQVVCIFIGCLIWYPFFKVSDKQRYEQEQSLEATVE